MDDDGNDDKYTVECYLARSFTFTLRIIDPILFSMCYASVYSERVMYSLHTDTVI